jgi:hypothetical protein
MSSSKKTFIVKPAAGSEGCGIFLIKKFKDIPSFAFGAPHVAQEYVDEPLLLNGKKFDLRIYVMVTNLQGPVTAFVANEGLVRLCTEDYKKPASDNLHNLLGHLTNYSLNKLSEKYVHTEDMQDEAMGSK